MAPSRGTLTTTLVGLGVLVTAGCGLFGDPVHDQWERRATLPGCGEVTLSVSDHLKQVGRDGIDCLRRAMESKDGGELIVHFPTVEGDPVTDYYRVNPDGSTEVYTDSTHDENSDQKWSYGSCDEPTSVLDVAC